MRRLVMEFDIDVGDETDAEEAAEELTGIEAGGEGEAFGLPATWKHAYWAELPSG